MALWDALRHRDFRLFFAGQSVSLLGDMVFFVALSWQVLLLGGTASTLGLVLSAYMGAQVALLIVGGVIVDRYRRRNVVIASDVIQGALVAGLAALSFAGALTMPLLVVFALGFGAAAAMAMPAMSAFVPETVPSTSLTSANSLYHGTRAIAMIAGPALGGALVAWSGTSVAFAFDAGTFVVSIALTSLARGGPAPERRPWTLVADVKGGLRYVVARPWLWIAIALFSLINVFEAGPRNVALPLLIRDDLKLGSDALGYVLAAQAAGSLVAFLALGAWPPSRRARGVIAYGGTLVSGLLFVTWGLATSAWWLAALGLAKAAAGGLLSIVWETTIGDSVHSDVRGRVISLDMLGSFVILPFAMLGTGLVAEAMGARFTFLAGGVAIVALALVGILVPAARRFPTEAA